MCDHDKNGNHFLSGLAFGAVLSVGLLYFLSSTEKGKRLKKELQEKGEDVVHNLTDLVEEIEETGSEFRDKAMVIKAEIEKKAERKFSPKTFTKNGKPLAK